MLLKKRLHEKRGRGRKRDRDRERDNDKEKRQTWKSALRYMIDGLVFSNTELRLLQSSKERWK
jgi:hypothetical protein